MICHVLPLYAQAQDTALASIGAAMLAAEQRVDSVWPGYAPTRSGVLLLAPREYAVLVRNGGMTARSFPPEFSATGWAVQYPLGSDTVAALQPLGATTFAKLVFIYHESFHGFQHRAFSERSLNFQRDAAFQLVINSVRFKAEAEQERALLLHALYVDDDSAVRSMAIDYIAMRNQRLKAQPLVAASEREMERREGTAEYAACQSAARATNGGVASARSCVAHWLERPLEEWPNAPEPNASLVRWRQYGTGAALCVLLERISRDWQIRVEKGEALDEILAAALMNR